jgi:hypothetical protein
MVRFALIGSLLAGLLLPPGAEAQPQTLNPVLIERNALDGAAQVRDQLRQLLRQHPPSLSTVLRADPSLLERSDYLAPYPRLASFLKEHPEILRDPAYYFGNLQDGYAGYFVDRTEMTPQERATNRAMNTLEGVLAGMAAFAVGLTAILVLASLVRQAIGHRRWLRLFRIQTEVHTKILDRLQSNEDLMAYVQSPAGQRFLESGPAPAAVEARAIGAPYGRILWSIQAGVMLVALGVGFWVIQRNAMAEITPALHAISVIAFALGAGALCSAALSYILSVRLGLLTAKE